MRFAIRETVEAGLCSSCQHGHVYERTNRAVTAICTNACEPFRVPIDIVKCTEYVHATAPTRHDFEQIAWDVKVDAAGKILGFTPPKKEDR